MSSVRTSVPHVERRPGVCGGVAVVLGTRTPVWMLTEAYLRGRESVNAVGRAFPQRSRAEILAALLYFEEHRQEILAQVRSATHERRRAAATTARWLSGKRPVRRAG